MYDLSVSKVARSRNVVKIMEEFAGDPQRPRYGYDLMQTLGLGSGALYPVVHRLRDVGYLTVEGRGHSNQRGAPRLYYKITADGLAWLAGRRH